MGIRGLPNVQSKMLSFVNEKVRAAAGAALYQEGLAIDAIAVEKCPVDTGRLRATHYVGPPEEDGTFIRVKTGFGTTYAVHVHERLDLRHPVGEAKFLEKAYDERRSGMPQRLIARTRENLKNGVFATPISAPTEPNDPGPKPQIRRGASKAEVKETRAKQREWKARARKGSG